MSKWDSEYTRRGIPSSFRDQPSGVLTWTLVNWRHLTGNETPRTAVDVGCGTGRNAIHMADVGIEVLAFDSSEVALQTARERLKIRKEDSNPSFLKQDLADGIPAEDQSFDLATDIFVYKHQISPAVRAAYRQELRRVLRPNARFLLSLAEARDGYYSSCPAIEPVSPPLAVMDPIAGIASVLFTMEELCEEMADVFDLEMSWLKVKVGPMHGGSYLRRTLATIWKIK